MARSGGPAARSAALAAVIGTLFGCAGAGGPRAGQMPESQTALARPEPDPTCRATVRAPLVANGLERVTVKVGVDHAGKLTVLEFLSPDVTPAAALELRRVFAECAWKPAVGPDGQPRDALTTLLFGAGK